MRIKQGILIRIIITFILMTGGTASAAIITVDDSSGKDHTTIQAAINAANDSDTILVYNGTYIEHVYVNKEITIVSESGNPDDTIVLTAGVTYDDTFNVIADNVTISGFNVSGGRDNVGIYLGGVSGCIVTNNILSNHWAGIQLHSSNNNMLSNNTAISNSEAGIRVLFSSSNTLSNNIASNDRYWNGVWHGYGIYLHGSSNYNTLSNNTVSKNEDGIFLWEFSNNNILNNNTVSNNEEGIFLWESSGNNLSNNTVSNNNNNGIRIFRNSNNNNLISNTVSSNTGGGIALSVSSNHNNLNNNMAMNNNNDGILLWESSGNNLSNNTVLYNDEYGINLDYSSRNNLINNTVSNNKYHGINLDYSGRNNLISNTVSNNYHGIDLRNSSNNNLTSNTVAYNDDGITLTFSSNNNLSNNTVSNNNYFGIILGSNNTMTSNTVTYNGWYGILLRASNTMTNNTVAYNGDHGGHLYYTPSGIYLEYSSGNIIYNNHFNNRNNVVFSETNTGNVWNTTKTSGTNIIDGPFLGGNYWAHPDGTGFSQIGEDINGDGICDSPYTFNGNTDYLPLFELLSIETFNPETPVSSVSGELRVFSIIVNKMCNITWLMDSTMVQEDYAVAFSSYEYNSFSPGTYNVTVIAKSDSEKVQHMWNWTVVPVAISDNERRGGVIGGGVPVSKELASNILFKDVAQQNVAYGAHVEYYFEEDGNCIVGLKFNSKKNAGRIFAVVEMLKGESTLVSTQPPGKVYQNMNILVGSGGFTTPENIENAVVEFKVEKSWISENDIDEFTICLCRNHNGEWDVLPTQKTGEDDLYIYFEAETPGFSPFAIVGFEEDQSVSIQDSTQPEEGISATEDDDTQPESKGIPWISAGSLILILVGVHLLMRKRG